MTGFVILVLAALTVLALAGLLAEVDDVRQARRSEHAEQLSDSLPVEETITRDQVLESLPASVQQALCPHDDVARSYRSGLIVKTCMLCGFIETSPDAAWRERARSRARHQVDPPRIEVVSFGQEKPVRYL